MIDKELHRGDIVVNERNDKRFYAVVVTNDVLNYHEDYVCCVNITANEVEGGPMYAPITVIYPGHAFCGRVWNVWKSDIVEFVRECTAEEMAGIDKALRYSFGLVETQTKIGITEMADALQKGAQDALEEHIAKLEEKNSDLSCKVHEQTEQITYLNRELEDARKNAELFMQKAVAVKDTAAEVTSLTAERDTYKAMYETLLDRMFRK